jgi:hypothetical protein
MSDIIKQDIRRALGALEVLFGHIEGVASGELSKKDINGVLNVLREAYEDVKYTLYEVKWKMVYDSFNPDKALEVFGYKPENENWTFLRFAPGTAEYAEIHNCDIDTVVKAIRQSNMDLDDAHNEAPPLSWIVKNKNLLAFAEGYIVSKLRNDARISVDGIYIKPERYEEAIAALEPFGKPDENFQVEVDGAIYYRLWWD